MGAFLQGRERRRGSGIKRTAWLSSLGRSPLFCSLISALVGPGKRSGGLHLLGQGSLTRERVLCLSGAWLCPTLAGGNGSWRWGGGWRRGHRMCLDEDAKPLWATVKGPWHNYPGNYRLDMRPALATAMQCGLKVPQWRTECHRVPTAARHPKAEIPITR